MKLVVSIVIAVIICRLQRQIVQSLVEFYDVRKKKTLTDIVILDQLLICIFAFFALYFGLSLIEKHIF